jgi:hypothetical protein
MWYSRFNPDLAKPLLFEPYTSLQLKFNTETTTILV